jgi:hypothetical protein
MAQPIRRKPVSTVTDYQMLRVSSSVPSTPSTPSGDRVSNSSVTLSLNQPSSNTDSTQLSSKDEKLPKPAPTTQYAPWGIHWRKPAFIVSFLLVGLALSLGHHFYYLSLNNQRSGDAAKQAWPTRIGTGLAFLVTSCFKAGATVALGQYIWTIVKHQSFTMGIFIVKMLEKARLTVASQQI